MAEFDPRDALRAPNFNQWGFAGIPKDNDFYDLLDETKAKTDAFFETVNLIFDIVNTFLDFIASLLIDFSNPLKIIIEEIIAILEAFVQDLRNLGMYITWDKFEGKDLSVDFLGGYPAFEQRMVKKLLSIEDRSRPNFTSKTKVFAITFFAGADASGIKKVIGAIQSLIALFTPGQSDEKPKAPINVEASFYKQFIGDIELPSTYTPDGVRIKWKLPPPSSTLPAFPLSYVLPDYFLFSVATRKPNEEIGFLTTVSRSAGDPSIKSKGSNKTSLVPLSSTDARLWPLLKTTENAPYINYKKLREDIDIEPLDKTPNGVGLLDRLWVLYNEDNVYLNNIEGQKISEVYRTFIYEVGGLVSNPFIGDEDFSFDIPLESLKIDGLLEDEYYITVYSMDAKDKNLGRIDTKDIPGVLNNLSGRLHAEILLSEHLVDAHNGNYPSAKIKTAPNITTLSLPSQIATVKTPTDLRSKYIFAVRFFFLTYALGNLNNKGAKELEIQAFTPEELKFIKRFTKSDDGIDALQEVSRTKQEFAQEVLEWVDDIMINFKHLIPSDVVLSSNIRVLNEISNFKYDLYQIISDAAVGGTGGIYPNSFSWRTSSDKPSNFGFSSTINLDNPNEVANYSTTIVPEEAGIIFEADENIVKYGDYLTEEVTRQNNPVLWYPDGDLKYFGNLFYLKDFKENFDKARPLIMLSNQSDEVGEWVNVKPFRDTDLSALLDFIDTVKKTLEGFIKGFEGIVAQILKFIHMLKTRIAQLQAVIAKIKAFIDLVLSFRFPVGLYGCLHLTDGTQGLVNSLTQSEFKPDIGTDGYGAGSMIVAGGVPSILIDFFTAILGGGEE
jgi:hypothetical protein